MDPAPRPRRTYALKRRYRVRPAKRADLHHLPRIEKAAANRFFGVSPCDVFMATTFPLELLEERQLEGSVWVAIDTAARKPHPVGFAVASVVDGAAHLDELSVVPGHGRRGLGTRLVEAVCAWARASHMRSVTLSTQREIPWNEPFYVRLGFRALALDELSAGLARLREAEASAGFPVEQRVIMKREV